MFKLFKKIFNKKDIFFPGVIIEKDLGNNIHKFEEGVAKANTPIFQVKKLSELRKFPYQYQYTSSGCVSYGTAKIACVLYYLLTGRIVKFSPVFWYSRRINKPKQGMLFSDITKLASEGCCLYDLLPCEGFTEEQMNNTVVEQYHKD